MSRRALELSREQVEQAVKNTSTAKQAADVLGVKYTSFIRYAKKYDLYITNQGGKGLSKPKPSARLTTKDLNDGITRNRSSVKKLLFRESLRENRCEICGQGPQWNSKPLVLHLDHIDGNPSNNSLENLQILCPNCHTQTSTYCRGQGKNRKN